MTDKKPQVPMAPFCFASKPLEQNTTPSQPEGMSNPSSSRSDKNYSLIAGASANRPQRSDEDSLVLERDKIGSECDWVGLDWN